MTRTDCVSARWLDDPAAFGAFYDEALPVVYRYFMTRCGRRHEVAEDLTQETFASAMSVIRRGITVESPLPWILGIARHRLADHYRRSERESRKLRLAYVAAPGDALHADVPVSSSQETMLAVMQDMPAMQRAALSFRYLDDLPVAEVAQLLGRSVHATESLLARGRETLRRAYGEAEA